MRRLHYKLSAAMLAIVLVLGGAFYRIDRYSVELYFEELTQRLNAALAMYIVNAEPLIDGGIVNSDELRSIASRAMVINPTAEIYLLDSAGVILGHALPPEEITTAAVDLQPIRALLDGTRPLPIKGPNPRSPGAPKVFSVFPVTDAAGEGADPAGYLYVVLGGSEYESVAAEVATSYRQRTVAASIGLLVVGAGVAGALLFGVLTRRLRRLTTDVTAATADGFGFGTSIERVSDPGDEIDQLQNACHAMLTTINRQLATLEETDKLRRELVTNISHDLRTPLASMQGYIETLLIKERELDDDTRRRYLETARRHATRLAKLIQDLFELAMLDADRVTPALEQFSLLELIYDVVQEFELRASDARIDLAVEAAAEPVLVYADISLIQRVLENLVGNALKHTPAGGKVSIAVEPSASGVGVSVADTGCGISADALPYVFDRFYKNNEAGACSSESTGLGLAIAKRILELHGSEIRVVSEERRGTRFDFDLSRQARAA